MNNWMKYAIPLATLNGILYFMIAVSGGANLQRLLHFDNQTYVYMICIGAAFVYGMFAFKAFETLTLKPTTRFTFFLTIISPLAATSFLTAGVEGAQLLHFTNLPFIISCGVILFIFRAINFIDGTVKLPARLAETHATWKLAFTNKSIKALLCVLISIYAAVGYSLSTTDPIYAALMKIAGWSHLTLTPTLTIVAYAITTIAAIAGFPMILYWVQRGLNQITNSGRVDSQGINRDPTDIFTYLALIAATPVILGSLGAATALHPEIFGRFGLPAEIVRVTTSAIFAVCAGIPGLATLFRGIQRLVIPEKQRMSSRKVPQALVRDPSMPCDEIGNE